MEISYAWGCQRTGERDLLIIRVVDLRHVGGSRSGLLGGLNRQGSGRGGGGGSGGGAGAGGQQSSSLLP